MTGVSGGTATHPEFVVTVTDTDGPAKPHSPSPNERSTFNGNDTSLLPSNKGNIPLRRFLRQHEISHHGQRHYWTDKLIRHLMTREQVENELSRSEYNKIKDQAKKAYVDIVCPPEGSSTSETYFKIFAILVLIEQVEAFDGFVRDRVCDQSLPLVPMKGPCGEEELCLEANPESPLNCCTKWKDSDKIAFERTQWGVLTPYFDLKKDGSCKEFDLRPDTILPWKVLPGDVMSGAYGDVYRVEIHPTSHGFSQVLRGMKLNESILAIKKPHKKNEDHFRREFEHLQRFSGRQNPHLVTTLGAFKFQDRWNFIFPSADYDLDTYMSEKHPAPPPWEWDTVCWASEQLHGLMGALDTIHNPVHLHHNPVKLYGRHGDLKLDNVLCFQSSATKWKMLVITDFGHSASHRDTSRSNIPGKEVPGVPGYRPPECDIEGGTVSRAFDIWTLGCLFLEFVTWLLGGKELVEWFNEKRTTLFYTGIKNNVFYQLRRADEGGTTYVVQVKPEVTEWIGNLRNHQNCSRFIHDILSLIEMEMIVVLEANRQRSSSGMLQMRLQEIRQRCENDKAYALNGCPELKGPEYGPAVEVTLNEMARHLIGDYGSALPLHEGLANRAMSEMQLRDLGDS